MIAKMTMIVAMTALASAFFSVSAEAAYTGFVTPTSMTITFTSLSLIDTSGNQQSVLSGNYNVTFSRSGSDFSAQSIGQVSVPAGRFVGVNICYNTSRSVVLNGNLYQGTTTGSYTDGTTLVYSAGTNAASANSIQTSLPAGGATTLSGYTVGSGSNNCSTTNFDQTVCIESGGTGCQSTDTVVDPNSTPPNLNIVLDMYHSVAVDATNASLDASIPVYPYVMIGDPGAAIHLAASSGTGSYGDISLILDSAKKVLFASSWYNNGMTGFCSGVDFTTVSAVPTGVFLTLNDINEVASLNTGTGQLQFVAGNCSGSTCTSGGMVTVNNVIQAAGTSVSVTCPADSAASPPYLGYTYTSGSGVSGTNSNFKIARVVDPNNLLGICTSGSGSAISGHAGSCAATNTSGDGYP